MLYHWALESFIDFLFERPEGFRAPSLAGKAIPQRGATITKNILKWICGGKFFSGPSGCSLYCVKNEVLYRPPAGSRCLRHHTFSRTFPIGLPVISWQTPTPSNTPLTQLHTYEPAVLTQSSFTGQLNWLVSHSSMSAAKSDFQMSDGENQLREVS